MVAAMLTLFTLPAASASASTAGAQTGMSTAVVEYKGGATTLAALEEEIGETHCHDGKGAGELTCFATAREAEIDLLAMGGFSTEAAKATASKWGVSLPKQTRVAAAAAAAGTCHPWVTVRYYDGDNGTGSSVNLYCDYTNLGSVGWDNRVNSLACMVCSAVTNPMKTMQSFQGYSYSMLMQQTMAMDLHNAHTRNVISSMRLFFG
ncbi:hypothetical protein [Streptomyces hydrogenans]|uniref:hypothetical protein n=1 Tax=Streptomyces hydrogenans TaxID=1873719 RepID=UPI00167DF949|nr:hypothetical protein [Streptomyces hydrogenans]